MLKRKYFVSAQRQSSETVSELNILYNSNLFWQTRHWNVCFQFLKWLDHAVKPPGGDLKATCVQCVPAHAAGGKTSKNTRFLKNPKGTERGKILQLLINTLYTDFSTLKLIGNWKAVTDVGWKCQLWSNTCFYICKWTETEKGNMLARSIFWSAPLEEHCATMTKLVN